MFLGWIAHQTLFHFIHVFREYFVLQICKNLFLWLRFANKQNSLPRESRAAFVTTTLIYEVPRLLALFFLFSEGLFAFPQIGVTSSLEFLLSAVHQPLAKVRMKTKIVLIEVVRAEKIKVQALKSKEIVSLEEKECILRLRELDEFNMLLAQSSSSPNIMVLLGELATLFKIVCNSLKRANKFQYRIRN